MAAVLLPEGRQSYQTATGLPAVGWKLYSFLAGTNTPATTWQDALQAAPNTNPIIMDARGECSVFFNGTYKLVLRDASDNLIWTQDNVVAANIDQTVRADLTAMIAAYQAAVAAPTGSSLVGFQQAGTGAVAQTQQGKDRLTLDAADFGVVGDGVTNDTAAMQLAINYAASTSQTLRLPPLVRCGALNIPANTSIVGTSNRTRITAISGSYNMFTIAGSDVSIENLFIIDTAKSGGWDFIIACGTTQKDRIFITNVNSLDSRGFMTDSGSGSGYHVTTLVTQCQLKSHNGPGIQLTRAFAFQWYTRIVVDYVGVSTSNYTAFYFNLSGLGASAGGLNIIDCDVLGTMGSFANANQRGFDIRNTAAVWIINSRADGVCEIGWLFDTVNLIDARGLVSSLCGSHGLWLQTVTNSRFADSGLYGRNYLPSPPAGSDGIRFVSGCANISFNGGLSRDFTGNGLNKTAAQSGAILATGMQLIANTGYGAFSTGNSGLLVAASQFGGNVAGNYNLGGTSDYLQSSQLNSGAIANVGPGPVAG